MLYLITRSKHYYPDSGTGDWQMLTDNEVVARRHFDTLVIEDQESACLIALSVDGWAILDERDSG